MWQINPFCQHVRVSEFSPQALLPCSSCELWEEWQMRSVWHSLTEDTGSSGTWEYTTFKHRLHSKKQGGKVHGGNNEGCSFFFVFLLKNYRKLGWREERLLYICWMGVFVCTHTHTHASLFCDFSLLTTENVNKQFAHPGLQNKLPRLLPAASWPHTCMQTQAHTVRLIWCGEPRTESVCLWASGGFHGEAG